MRDDSDGNYDRLASALAACHELPPGIPERDALALRDAVVDLANRQITALQTLTRTLTPDEAKLMRAVSQIVNETIGDRRVVEARKQQDEASALEWLREQFRRPGEYQEIALAELPPEAILKRAREIEAQQTDHN